jgi:hypothetical protein
MDSVLLIALGAASVLALGLVRRHLWSFHAQRPEDYRDTRPYFDIGEHLNGNSICEGVIYGPLGRVSSRFVADFHMDWQGDRGVLKEHFVYDGGSTQDREWHLRRGNDGRIEATAPDVVGKGEGVQMGSTVLLRYKLRLPEASGGHTVDATDWMYLTADGTIINRSQFRKFGIQVAELVATIRPRDAERAPLKDAA